MKKIIFSLIVSFVVLGSSSQVYAANMVSEMAVNKGGQSVAECAKTMEKGVSECTKEIECTM